MWEVAIWLLGNRILGNHCSSSRKAERGLIQWNKANSLQFPWRCSTGMNRMLLPPLSSSTLEDLALFCQLSLAVPIWHITVEDQTPVCSRAHPRGVRCSDAKNTPSQNIPSQLSLRQVWNTCGCPEKQTDLWLLSKKSSISKLLHQMVNAHSILIQHVTFFNYFWRLKYPYISGKWKIIQNGIKSVLPDWSINYCHHQLQSKLHIDHCGSKSQYWNYL